MRIRGEAKDVLEMLGTNEPGEVVIVANPRHPTGGYDCIAWLRRDPRSRLPISASVADDLVAAGALREMN